MRTEVKIGIIIGLIVFGCGIVFVLNQGRQSGADVADSVPMRKPTAEKPTDPGASSLVSDERPAVRQSPSRVLGGQRSTDTRRLSHEPAAAGRPGQPAQPSPGVATPVAAQPAGTRRPVATTQPATVQPRPGSTPETARHPGAQPTSQPSRPLTVARGPSPTTQPTVTPRPTRREPAVTPPQPPVRSTGATNRLPAQRGVTRHTIQHGESLWTIATQYYNDGTLWPKIKAANPGLDESRLKPGQQIVIPPKEEATTDEGRTARERPADEGTQPGVRRHTYVVERGDTLISIARNILKDGKRWQEIYELNRSKIPDPNILTVGTELLLPAE